MACYMTTAPRSPVITILAGVFLVALGAAITLLLQNFIFDDDLMRLERRYGEQISYDLHVNAADGVAGTDKLSFFVETDGDGAATSSSIILGHNTQASFLGYIWNYFPSRDGRIWQTSDIDDDGRVDMIILDFTHSGGVIPEGYSLIPVEDGWLTGIADAGCVFFADNGAVYTFNDGLWKIENDDAE